MNATAENVLYGLCAGCATLCVLIGFLFVRYWKDSRDRLFLFFASAFWVFAMDWMTRFFVRADADRPFTLLLRVLAFALIIAAILDKNRRSR